MTVQEKYRYITLDLIKKGLLITTMESCTSGLVASLLTDTEGASAVFKGAYVTYSNEQKIRLGVDARIIDRYSVYSAETACEMAKVCRAAFNADIGIGVTGTTGNVDPENREASIPGHVYFAIDFKGNIKSFSITLTALESRYAYKLAAADAIAEELIRLLS